MTGKLYQELYGYGTLCDAYEAAFLYLDEPQENAEEWLINLQNHLVWGSYHTGNDPDSDTVVLSVIDILLKRHSLKISDTTGRVAEIIGELTPD